jgi:uncharacterized repeat protein (TIGR03833 family)
MPSGTNRADIKPGMQVRVVQKQDQRTGKLTAGVVERLLTSSGTHPQGDPRRGFLFRFPAGNVIKTSLASIAPDGLKGGRTGAFTRATPVPASS